MKDMVGAKFSTWGKADRFAYREVSTKLLSSFNFNFDLDSLQALTRVSGSREL